MNSISYLQKVTEAASDNGEVVKAIFDVSLNATQQLLALNGDFMRSFATGSATHSTQDLHEQVGVYMQSFERASEYFRNVNEICVKTQAEIATVSAQRAAEVTQTLVAQVDNLFQGSPLKTAGIADMLKSTLNTAGTACENIINTSREVAESTMTGATQALQTSANASRTSARSARKTA
ncbi:phasin family protein [Aromatoleum diolicum]|uniref:Phasin family protein n=1 Tax=Aromatoleum diolicum TaxID=75796 RepID=A0ABX1Q6R0_9RHOO|nr:phasin family protein [Aromatoleum diolicum]NMG73998.1 hypothetical protein [Aromatoleum diolicum]